MLDLGSGSDVNGASHEEINGDIGEFVGVWSRSWDVGVDEGLKLDRAEFWVELKSGFWERLGDGEGIG